MHMHMHTHSHCGQKQFQETSCAPAKGQCVPAKLFYIIETMDPRLIRKMIINTIVMYLKDLLKLGRNHDHNVNADNCLLSTIPMADRYGF